jgi:hypothetical protein
MRDGALEGERRGSTYGTVQGLQVGASSGRTSNYTRMSEEARDLFFFYNQTRDQSRLGHGTRMAARHAAEGWVGRMKRGAWISLDAGKACAGTACSLDRAWSPGCM